MEHHLLDYFWISQKARWSVAANNGYYRIFVEIYGQNVAVI